MTVDWIRIGLKRTGKTRSGLARALGRSPSAVTDLLNGHRRLRADEIATVSEYLGIEPPRLIGGGPPRPPSAPLIGYVGAGAVAHFYADGQGPFDDVDAPLDSKPTTVAVQIRGHSLGVLFDNWLVFYDDIHNPPDDSLVGRMCVCGLSDGRVLIKSLKRSPNTGLVEPSVQHRAADLRRRPRLGGAGARNAPEVGARRASVMPAPPYRARDRARASPLSLGHAGRLRRAALSARSFRQGRVRHRPRHLRGQGNARGPQPLCAVRRRAAQSRLRRPHRCRAAGRQGALAVRPVLGRDRRRRALGPRRLRHEGRRRRLRRRRAALHRQGNVRGLDQLPPDRRRGRPRRQRHGQARRLGAVARANASTIASWANRPRSRRSATRSSTGGAARSTDG